MAELEWIFGLRAMLYNNKKKKGKEGRERERESRTKAYKKRLLSNAKSLKIDIPVGANPNKQNNPKKKNDNNSTFSVALTFPADRFEMYEPSFVSQIQCHFEAIYPDIMTTTHEIERKRLRTKVMPFIAIPARLSLAGGSRYRNIGDCVGWTCLACVESGLILCNSKLEHFQPRLGFQL